MRTTVRAWSVVDAPPPRSAAYVLLRRSTLLAVLLLAGCATVDYEAVPIDTTEILRELRASGTTVAVGDATPGGVGKPLQQGSMTMARAAALAVQRNPTLKLMRAELGVSRARLVEAGLLPDPSIGWDAMDVLTNQWVNGDTEQENFVVGFGLTWRVPRPGEISAQESAAYAELEGSEWAVVRAEWALAREVADAWLQVASAHARLGVANELLGLARQTSTALDRAREARAVTGIESNLAAIDVAEFELGRLDLEDEAIEARQHLNALMGLSPEADYAISDAESLLDERTMTLDVESLVDAAIERRPDLAEIVARYAAAEAELQLEVVRQFPELSIGTGIELVLPFFSKWNGPAVDRAFARREVAKRAVTAEVARLRADVHASVAAFRRARRQVDYIAAHVEPRLEESLRLAEASLSSRNLSTLELLLTQRQVLDVRMRALRARFEAASSYLRVMSITGELFGIGTPNKNDTPSNTGEE